MPAPFNLCMLWTIVEPLPLCCHSSLWLIIICIYGPARPGILGRCHFVKTWIPEEIAFFTDSWQNCFSLIPLDIAEMTGPQLTSASHRICQRSFHPFLQAFLFISCRQCESETSCALWIVFIELFICVIQEHFISFPQGVGQTRFAMLLVGGRYLVATEKSNALISWRDIKSCTCSSSHCHQLLAFDNRKLC